MPFSESSGLIRDSWAQLAANSDFVAHAITGSAADRLAFLIKASSAHNDA